MNDNERIELLESNVLNLTERLTDSFNLIKEQAEHINSLYQARSELFELINQSNENMSLIVDKLSQR